MKAEQAKSTTDTSGIHLWLVLWKAFRSVEAHAQRHIAELDMCLSDFGVLEVLLHKGPLSVKELGAKVMLTSGSMTAALDRLGKRGLVEREEDSHDRRARVVRLTDAGTELIQAAFEDHRRAMEAAVSGVAKNDRKTLIDLLRRLGLGAMNRLELLPTNGVAAKGGGKESRKE
jgi:MarR family 2-MHQ and catechol resistance regulon transcriptional repressor